MKGIILAGGSGSRLSPLTICTSKQLLPVYDKPMIFYPLSALMLAGIRDILLITTPQDQDRFKQLLGDGSEFGVRLSYMVQQEPKGIAQALLLGAGFVGDDGVTLILGDNMFYGHGLSESLMKAVNNAGQGATIFSYHVTNPKRYGVVSVDEHNRATSIEEKPTRPKSNLAVTGLYIYDNDVLDIAASITPSARGELEITDVNRVYLEKGLLRVVTMGRGIAWLDTGTPQALLEASEFVRSLQRRQGLQIACLEEIAYRKGWIDKAVLERAAVKYKNSDYGKYLNNLAEAGCLFSRPGPLAFGHAGE